MLNKRHKFSLLLLVFFSMVLPCLIINPVKADSLTDDLAVSLGTNTLLASSTYNFGIWCTGNTSSSPCLNSSLGGSYSASGGRTSGGSIEGTFIDRSGARDLNQAIAIIDLGTEYNVTGVSFYFHATSLPSGTSNNPTYIRFYTASKSEVGSYNDRYQGFSPSTSWQQRTWSGDAANVRYIAMISLYDPNTSSPKMVIDDLAVTYGSGAGQGVQFGMRPLAQEDQDTTFDLQDKPFTPDTIFDMASVLTQWSGSYTLLQAISKAPGAYVHAVAPGVVTQIRPIDRFHDCGLFDTAGHNVDDGADNITGTIYTINSRAQRHCWIMLASADPHTMLVQEFSEGYIVTVEYDDENEKHWIFNYMVDNPAQYVSVGDAVSPGCVLGTTIALLAVPFANQAAFYKYWTFPPVNFIPFAPDGFDFNANFYPAEIAESGKGFAGVLAFNDTDQQFEPLAPITYPSNDTPCNSVADTYNDCLLSNPTFANNGDGWEYNDQVVFDSHLVLLQPGGSIYRSMVLDSTKDYTLTAGLLPSNAPTQLELFIAIGTERHTQTVADTVPSATLTVDADSLSATQAYNVGIRSIGGADDVASVRFLCLTEGAPNTAPGECYFNNAYFDFGLSGWDSSAVTGTDGAGEVIAQSPATLTQSVHLYPAVGGAQDYTFRIKIDSFADISTPPPTPDHIHVSYTYDGGTVDVGDIPLTADPATFNPIEVSYTFSVSAETTDDFVIQVEFQEADNTPITSEFLFVFITSACIAPDGGVFPGYGGGTSLPFIESCQLPDRPIDENLSSWISWLWLRFSRFFNCDLMVLLNRIYETLLYYFRMIGYVFRYWIALTKQSVAWLGNQFLPWLAGYMSNIATPTITVGGGTENCNNLFCVFTSLFDNIRAIFDSLAGVFIRVADSIDNLINQLAGLIQSIVNAILGMTLALIDLLKQAFDQLVFTFMLWIGFLWHMMDLVFALLSLIINGFLALIFTVITELFRLLNFVQAVLLAIVNGYTNATPQALPGLPQCSTIDPRSNWLCTAIWALDNTIFAPNQPGALLVPIIISLGSLFLLLWVAGEIMRSITKVSQVS